MMQGSRENGEPPPVNFADKVGGDGASGEPLQVKSEIAIHGAVFG
jgi:hypothetical protein